MNDYIVSARKYRPSTFNSVVGQRALTTTLKNAIATEKLAHAYLFCGPRGVGKTTCARIFAKTINCFTPTAEGEACNQCESCVAFNEQRSYNIHELDAASNNGVDDIRSLIEQVRIPPQVGKYKVYIIDEVHMLSQAAFNAFLKTLEEPPHHAIFILATTERHKVLPTILSRCQIYDFSRITIKDIVDHLQYVADSEKVTAETEALNVLAQKADGGMRDALSIFDQVVSFTGGNITYKAVIDNLNVLDYEYYFKLTDCILANNVTDALLILNEILAHGFDGNNILTGLAAHFRDLLLCKDPRTVELFEVGASIRQRYVETAAKCDQKLLYRAIEIVNENDLNYRLSRNKRLLCDLTIILLCQLSSADHEADDKKKNRVIKPIFTDENKSQQQAAIAAQPKSQGQPQTRSQATVPPAPKSSRSIVPPTIRQTNPNPANSPIGGLGVSLSAIRKGTVEETKTKVAALEDQRERFTSEQLLSAWSKFEDGLTDEKHLKNTMLSCKPELIGNEIFEIVVNNSIQEGKLEESKGKIMHFLKTQLKNTYIVMEIRISENNEKRQAFTSVEKLNLMIQENESIRKLKDIFGLEIT